jgi:hypothetical protein
MPVVGHFSSGYAATAGNRDAAPRIPKLNTLRAVS